MDIWYEREIEREWERVSGVGHCAVEQSSSFSCTTSAPQWGLCTLQTEVRGTRWDASSIKYVLRSQGDREGIQGHGELLVPFDSTHPWVAEAPGAHPTRQMAVNKAAFAKISHAAGAWCSSAKSFRSLYSFTEFDIMTEHRWASSTPVDLFITKTAKMPNSVCY